MFETILTHFNPDHVRDRFKKSWEDDPNDVISYMYWKRAEEDASPNPKAMPVNEVPLIRLPSETYHAHGEYLMLLMDLQPQGSQPKFNNIKKAKRIAQDTGLDQALENIPRPIIENAMSVECTMEWGDGWEILEPHLDNDAWESPYRDMMDWIAGGGYWTGQIIRKSREVTPAYERLTQLLLRLQTAKDSGDLDAANREKKQHMTDQFAISTELYNPANIWFDDP